MLAERFVVDEAGFEFLDEDPNALELTLRRFTDLLEYARATDGVTKWSELWSIEAASGRSLSELLFSTDLVDRDVRLLLGGRLDKIRCWDDDKSLSPELGVRVGQLDLVLAPSIALCVAAHQEGRGVACLTSDQAGRRGPIPVSDDAAAPDSEIHFLVERRDGAGFWRSIVTLEDLNAEGLASLSPLAFPQLVFGPATWSQIDRFEGSFRDLRSRLVRDLSGLDDHAAEVWRSNVEPARISAEMASRAGVDCSRDSPSTHSNAAAMRERRVDFDGTIVTCEWHTKLEAHRNRVHFAVVGGQVWVGIFASHLRT